MEDFLHDRGVFTARFEFGQASDKIEQLDALLHLLAQRRQQLGTLGLANGSIIIGVSQRPSSTAHTSA